MEIRSVQSQLGPEQVSPANAGKAQAGPASPQPLAGQDTVEISEAARVLEIYHRLPEIRADKVAQARQAIEAGTMDTDERLSVAIDRLLDDLLPD